MKRLALALVILGSLAHAGGKKTGPEVLPVKGLGKEDPLSLDVLLDPGQPVPEILPAPEALPEPPAGGKQSGGPGVASAKAELISAANDYRRKTELFRKGKLSRDALRASAVRVAQSAKTYRASLRR